MSWDGALGEVIIVASGRQGGERGKREHLGSWQYHHGLGHPCTQHGLQGLVHKCVMVCVISWGAAQVKHDGKVKDCGFLQQLFQRWYCLVLSLLPVRA